MDMNKLNKLRLLEEISENDSGSQRDFSKKLNISLGLVNAFIKRLVNKGYCKITTIPKRRVKYILTPKGAVEKTKLTYEYLLISYKFYKDSQKKILNLYERLEKSNVQNIVFWGAGELTEIAYALISETSLRLVGIVDGDMAGDNFDGFCILAPKDIQKLEFDKIICTQTPDKIKTDDISKVMNNEMVCYLL